jgi:tRNA A37 methylthiotransferase MiaB
MKIYFINEGKCGEANYLYKRIRSYILINGFEVVDSFEEGEMLIMNTCNSSMRITRKNQETIEKYKDKKIFIIGC